jgi:hypothetical protein
MPLVVVVVPSAPNGATGGQEARGREEHWGTSSPFWKVPAAPGVRNARQRAALAPALAPQVQRGQGTCQGISLAQESHWTGMARRRVSAWRGRALNL